MRSASLLEVAFASLLLGTPAVSPYLHAGENADALTRSRDYPARLDIRAGDISAAEFLRFVADFTGIPVIVVGGDDPLDSTFSVASPVEDVDGLDITAILEENGWRVSVRSFENGQKAIELRASRSPEEKRRGTRGKTRRVFRLEGEKLLVAEDGDSPLARHGILPDDPVAVVARLDHARPVDAVETLGELMPAKERDEPLHAAPIPGSSAVALSGRAAEVDEALRLLRAIDVEESRRRIRSGVHRLKHANASDVVAVVETLLAARSGNGDGTGAQESVALSYGDDRLVIQAPPREYEEILRLVEALDVAEE